MTDRQAKQVGVKAARSKYARMLIKQKGLRTFLLATNGQIGIFMMPNQPRFEHIELKFKTMDTAFKAVEEFSKLRYRFV